MRLYSLGRCEIEIGETRLTPDAERLFALALYLVVAEGRPLSRSHVTQMIWPSAADELAAHSLRQAVYRLRNMGARIHTSRGELRLPTQYAVADYLVLPDTTSSNVWQGGPFLPGYDPRFSAAFRSWLEQQRSIVHSSLRRRLITQIVAARQKGDWALVEVRAQECLAIDCLNEEATLALAEAAAMHGSKARSIQVLDQYLREIGPVAGDIRLPAVALRNRIVRANTSLVATGRVVPFVGRETYLAELNTSLSLACDSRGSFNFVWGEPGIGKTRLVRELLQSARLRDVYIAFGSARAGDQSRPLACFVELLPTLLSLPGTLGISPDSLKRLRALASETAELENASGDPLVQAAHNRRALLELVDAVAEEKCLLLMIEDVHWADDLSAELLSDLAIWVTSRQVMVVATSRNRDFASSAVYGGALSLREQRLRPLSDEESHRLLKQIGTLLPLRLNDPQAARCVTASAGNPYHLTELAFRSAHERGNAQFELSLAALVRQRLDRISPASLRVLQAAAVLGKHATVARVRDLLERPIADLLDSFDELESQALLEIADNILACRHEMVANTVQAKLGTAAGRLLHLSAARILARESGEAGDNLLWDSADHWLQGGDYERAISGLKACSEYALGMGSPMEAARVLSRALELPQSIESRTELIALYAHVLEKGALWKELAEALEEKRRLQLGRDFRPEHDSDELLLIEAKWRRGDDPEVLLHQLRTCTRPACTPQHRVHATAITLKLCDNLFVQDIPREIFAEIRDVLHHPEVPAESRLECELIYHCSFGDIRQSINAAREWIALSSAKPRDSASMRARFYGAVALGFAGQLDEARSNLLEVYEFGAQHGIDHLGSAAAHELSSFALLQGDVQQAAHWTDEATRLGRRANVAFGTAGAFMQSACVALYTGDYLRAERMVQEAERHPVVHSYRRSKIWIVAFRLYLPWKRFGSAPDTVSLAQLLDLLDSSRGSCGIDQLVVMTLELLEGADRKPEARLLASKYIASDRRERTPLMPLLQVVYERLMNSSAP